MSDSIRKTEYLSVWIVDDNARFVSAMASALNRRAQMHVTAVYTDPEELVSSLDGHPPDVLLVDVAMPKMSGSDVVRTVRDRHPAIDQVALTVSSDASDILDMLRAGARGYVLKSDPPEQVAQAIRSAASGDGWFSARVAGILITEFNQFAAVLGGSHGPQMPEELGLTPREQAVLRQLATGKTNREIARSLGIAESTVKTHVRNILEKLHLRNRVEAVLLASRFSRS